MSGPERQAISDLLSLLGLSLDGLIIEEVPKLPPMQPTALPLSKPIDQQLILSIRAPVAKEDLLEMKSRAKTLVTASSSEASMFFLEEPVNKNPWSLEIENHIKGMKVVAWLYYLLLQSYSM